MQEFDVAVVGLGVMGSAVLNHLTTRGLTVIGIDRHSIPHTFGSSHGGTRLIREAYYEHPMYVPLVRRALELWRELEREVQGEQLLVTTGSLMIGERSSDVVQGTLRSATEFGITHEVLKSDTLHRRFPAFTPLDDMVGVYEPGSGVLFPDRVLAALIRLAASRGAVIEPNVQMVRFDSGPSGVRIETPQTVFHARQIVLCAGPWLPDLLPELDLWVERQVMHWYEPDRAPELLKADRMPVSLWQLHDGRVFYTMPDFGAGVKVGWHHGGQRTSADDVAREVSNEEWAAVTDLLRRFVPMAKGPRLASRTCLYTNTADGHFLIDQLPHTPAVHVVSACSGHGFKFAPVVGEILADVVTGVGTRFDLSPFRLTRVHRAPA